MEDSKTMQYLKRLFPAEDKRLEFLSACTLTYGLNLETLEELLKIDKNIIYSKLISINGDKECFDYLFFHRFNNQELALQEFQTFFKSFLWAKVNKDREKMKSLQKQIYDYDAKEFLDTRPYKTNFTENDYITLAKYQIKYAIGSNVLARIFGINASNYRDRVRVYLALNPILLQEYDNLVNYIKQQYDARHLDNGGAR